jgi:hypothetical protein
MNIYTLCGLQAKSKKRITDAVSDLKCKYGLSESQFINMFKQQNGTCAICKKPDLKRLLCVDHCHTTGRVRGLLCYKCNLAIGHLKDNTGSLKSAIEYLQKEKTPIAGV